MQTRGVCEGVHIRSRFLKRRKFIDARQDLQATRRLGHPVRFVALHPLFWDRPDRAIKRVQIDLIEGCAQHLVET
jgi:hypothetical protein